jgi:hypothetical protein
MSKLNGWEYHKNGGRICWYVKSITSGRKEKGAQAQKCAECNFFQFVAKEEGSNLTIFV